MKIKILTILLGLLLLSSAAVADETKEDEQNLMTSGTFAGLKLRNIGPAFMSGRIADIAIHPDKPGTWYVAVGSGNVWKTDNAGTTWTPLFDNYGSYSIGCITIDPNNHEVLWLGTGENVSGRHVGYGDGIYKSLDGGKSWTNMGLKESEHISKIVVDPRDSNVVFVAVQGPLWSPGGERGVYKTIDGGKTWENVLSKGEYTGANEVVMDPENPDLLYAALHQRHRTVAALINGGPESGIYKSEDGGLTWRELKSGLPEGEKGKIGLAVSPQNHNVIYATIELAGSTGGFYRSENRGETWVKQSDYLSGGTGPHYYQEIFASPHAFDRIYQMDVYMHWSEDGGKNFKRVGEKYKHVDNHALAFSKHDPDYLLAGCDGGLYESWDLGENWKFIGNLPITQFYKVAIDNDLPFYNIYGGTQDNNTQGGPSRTDSINGIVNSDWFVTLGGDGYQPACDPENPDIVYCQLQNGNLVRYDRKTGETISIKPQPGKGEPNERWNWDSPILVSPHNSKRLYFGSRRLWESEDRGDSWTPISEDLSRGIDRLKTELMGRVWSIDAIWDLRAMSNYGNLTSLSESPLQAGLLYAGTDDGLIQVTENDGETWTRYETFADVPQFSFVNDIKADLFDTDTVYAVFDNHKKGDFKPYIVKSVDRGKTWISMVGDLPDRHIVWRIVQDHVNKDLFFLATEYGIFFTINGGENWIKLTGGVPVISFRDLAIQKRENDLVCASFGRGFFIFDDYSPLRQVSEEMLEQELKLFPVKDAHWYVPRAPLGDDEKASQGGGYFTAPNPEFGATFTYYMKESIKTDKQIRQEEEAKIQKEGGDTPYPGWEKLSEENYEISPAIVITITDENGDLVRKISGPASAGFHRISWDLRYEGTMPISYVSRERNRGPLVIPGVYTASLYKKVDGKLVSMDQSEDFRIVPMKQGSLETRPWEESVAFYKKVLELNRVIMATLSAIDAAKESVTEIKTTLENYPGNVEGFQSEAQALFIDLDKLWNKTYPNRADAMRGRLPSPTPFGRLQNLYYSSLGNTYGPTKTQIEQFEIARDEFTDILEIAKELINVRLRKLENDLEAAKIPWTKGRALPEIK